VALQAIGHHLRQGARAAQAANQLDFFPLRETLRGYNGAAFRGDLRAGINVALLAFPQGMAYALIAGLPIQYGIYGSAIAAMIAPVFAGSRFIMLGPTNATSVMLLSAFATFGLTGAEKAAVLPLLLLIVGVFLVLGAYLRVAAIIQYISRAVITGYITAAALLIVTNQIPEAFGLELRGLGSRFYLKIQDIALSLPTTHGPTLAVSLVTGLTYIVLTRRFRALPNVAVTLVVASAASVWAGGGALGVDYLKGINAANWQVTLPAFDLETANMLAGTAFAIALLSVLEGSSIGKSLAARTGSRLDVNQEMLSIGMANIGCAFLSGMPASGSLTRSTLNVSSGAKTTFASFIAGCIVFAGAFLVGPFTAYVPKATLAVLVIAIGVSLFNRHAISLVTHTTRSDAVTFFVTCGGGLLFSLDTAIYLGVGTSIVLFMKKVAKPEMVEYTFTDEGHLAAMGEKSERAVPEVSIVHVEGELFFGAAELFRDQIRRVCEDPNLKVVVLKMRNAHNMDATAIMALEELVRYMNERDRHLILSEARDEVIRVLKRSGLYETIGEANIFADFADNPTMSTAQALKRAQEHLGSDEANVSIYVDPARDQEKGKRQPDEEA